MDKFPFIPWGGDCAKPLSLSSCPAKKLVARFAFVDRAVVVHLVFLKFLKVNHQHCRGLFWRNSYRLLQRMHLDSLI